MSEPLRVGLLGAGWFGREAHLRNLVSLPGCDIVAASSRGAESRGAARAIAGDDLTTFENWQDLLAGAGPLGLDAVIVALTNDQHHEACLMAYEKGLHVLCEKPLGLTLAQCDEIIAAAASADRVLQIGHEMRYQRLYQEMKRMIDEGAVGDPALMWCREFRGPMRPGWRSIEALTGGTLLEKNCHHFDLFNWMIDRAPVRVGAQGGTSVLKDREILDNAQVIVEYPDDRRATLDLCLFAPYGGDCEIGVAGGKGRIDTENQALRLVHHRFDLPDRTEMRIADAPEDANFVDSSGRVDRGIRSQLVDWVASCSTGAPVMNSGESARESVAICLAAQASIQRKEFVEMAEFSA